MLAPIPAGYVRGQAGNPFLHVWGGVVVGLLSTLVPLTVARWLKHRATPRFLALMTAAFCLGHNSLYLFVGGILPFGDAQNMIQLGAPRWLLLLLGVPPLIGFVLVLASAVRPVSLRAEPLWRWIIVVEAGLLAIPALMVLALVTDQSARSMLLPMLMLVGTYALCFGVAAYQASVMATPREASFEISPMSQDWTTTFALLVGAMLLIAFEWIVLRPA